jgi:hypothetical protein
VFPPSVWGNLIVVGFLGFWAGLVRGLWGEARGRSFLGEFNLGWVVGWLIGLWYNVWAGDSEM